MKKINILHLITRLPIGGAERMLLGVLHNLDSNQFNSVVCCIQDRGELADEVESIGVPVISLGLMKKGRYDRSIVPILRNIMNEHHINVIHTHLYHANLYGRIAANKESIPTIASVHNTYAKRKWHRHLINWFLAKRTFRITAGSAAVKDDLLKVDHIKNNKVAILPNAIDLQRVQSNLSNKEAKYALGIESTDILIGTVGRVEEQKGHKYLLEAISHLKNNKDIQNIKLLIVGDGRLLPSLKLMAKNLDINDISLFPGNISNLGDIYRAIDIFVMPSLWEGLSLSMLEAMAAKLPIIATDVGGVRDVLGDNKYGKIVNPSNHIEISSAIKSLIQNYELSNKMAILGEKKVRSEYSVKAMTKQLETLYIDALN